MFQAADSKKSRTLAQEGIYLFSMAGILVFLNWAPSGGTLWLWDILYRYKYGIVLLFAAMLIYAVFKWFSRDELKSWLLATRDFAVQILPLLFAGVLVAGFLLGRPGHRALVPQEWVAALVGGNSLLANLIAAVSGALMYFATLTEVPIMQGLIGAGMGQGPALALLLAGPSLSLPSILIIASELGWVKTLTYVLLVVAMSTGAGWLFGNLVIYL
jgi:uncharacterized membrane protein YraQ (UPF0718 family)